MGRDVHAERLRGTPRGLGWILGALAVALVVSTFTRFVDWSSTAHLKLSEGAHQIAYPAGLGPDRTSLVPASRKLTSARTRCSESTTSVGSARVSYAALVTQATVIRREPTATSPAVAKVDRLNPNGFRQVLGVVAAHSSSHCATDWYRVQLSVVPNGTVGWVRAWAVQTYRVRSRVVVDLSQRLLRVYQSGKLALATPVAVGATATPTPRGRYFVNERYTLPDSSGPFGPNALGISAHSDVLQHVWVEDGPIGIHGTNEPWSIGHAASHGCIRVANSVMRRLFRLAPAGTPIIITA